MLSIGWSLGYRRDLSSLAFHWIPHVCFFFPSVVVAEFVVVVGVLLLLLRYRFVCCLLLFFFVFFLFLVCGCYCCCGCRCSYNGFGCCCGVICLSAVCWYCFLFV